jgi:uncharacterized LabA/DUF88 family protein
MAMQEKNNYAFIDSQNLNLGIQKMGWKMDWRKFRQFLADEYGVSKAFMFIGHMTEHEDLYLKMHGHGFLVVLKPTVDMTNPKNLEEKKEPEKPEDKKPVKGNIDADLVLWAMKELPNYDKAIVVSGDGDFYSLYEYLDEKGKLLHIMTPNWQFSQLLNQFKDYIVRLDLLKAQLSHRDFRRSNPKK